MEQPVIIIPKGTTEEEINVRQISVNETAAHASKRYLSTLAVLQLDAILACARKVKQVKPKQNTNQSVFQGIMVMTHICPGIGTVKLTVGIKQRSVNVSFRRTDSL